MKESDFQKNLIIELKQRFPGCVVLKNDPTYIQGVPDLLILNDKTWAALECKGSKRAKRRPNQDYYVDMFDTMSYASYIYPENKEEVLNDLEHTFKSRR